MCSVLVPYSRLRNKHRGTLINFWTFFQGLHSLLERVMPIFFFKISTILWYGGCLFKGLRLIFLPNVPWATFIPGATSIQESGVNKSGWFSEAIRIPEKLYSLKGLLIHYKICLCNQQNRILTNFFLLQSSEKLDGFLNKP